MRAWGAWAVIGVCVLAGTASAVPAASTVKSPAGKALRALQGVNFISACRTSQVAEDILGLRRSSPGQSKGAAMALILAARRTR